MFPLHPRLGSDLPTITPECAPFPSLWFTKVGRKIAYTDSKAAQKIRPVEHPMNFLPSPLDRSNRNPRRSLARVLALTAALSLSYALVGCGGTVAVPGGGGSTAPPVVGYIYLTGNWEFQVTPGTGTTLPFTSFAGFINEQGQNPGNFDESTAVFQVNPASGCYNNIPDIPLSGNVQGTKAAYSGFSVNGQYFNLTLTRNTAGNQLTGTYKDSGGCIGGSTGTVTGTKFGPLTGTYTGSIGTNTPAPTVSVTTTQGGQGTGSGTTQLAGNATFTGFTCFTKGGINVPESYVLGSAVVLTVNTNDPTGAQAILTGTFDSGATTITLTSVNVTSGSCSGNYGTATLTN